MGAISVTIPADRLSTLIEELDALPHRIPATIAGAINDTAKKSLTQLNRRIRERVVLKREDIAPYIRLVRATAEKPRATITINESRRLSLRAFGAKQTNRGVTYRIAKDGGRKVVPSAFIVEKLNNQVFKRKGKSRFPIVKLHGISTWGVVVKAGLDKEVVQFSTEELLKQLDRRVNFELLKASGAIER